jgi:hypothetical protein
MFLEVEVLLKYFNTKATFSDKENKLLDNYVSENVKEHLSMSIFRTE